MGFTEIFKKPFELLIANPLLFLPKFISNTLWLLPYLMLMGEFKKVLAYSYAYAQTGMAGILQIWGIFILIIPFWLLLEGMYPPLVEQCIKGKVNFFMAFRISLSKFIPLLAFLLLSLGLFALLAGVPIFLISYGFFIGKMELILACAIFVLAVAFFLSAVFYFTPTAVLLEKGGAFDSFLYGMRVSKEQMGIVSVLTLFTFFLFAIGALVEGVVGTLGTIGFVIGRYLGGIFAVYAYVMNTNSYLEFRERR